MLLFPSQSPSQDHLALGPPQSHPSQHRPPSHPPHPNPHLSRSQTPQQAIQQSPQLQAQSNPLLYHPAAPQPASASSQPHPGRPSQLPYQSFQGLGQHVPPAYVQQQAYQHLRQGSAGNASPSPVVSAQSFRPPAAPQRGQTASPTAFPQQPNNYNMSPPPPDQASRVATPHGASQLTFGPAAPYGTSYGPHFNAPAVTNSAQLQNAYPTAYMQNGQAVTQQQSQAQWLHQARLRQQQQQQQAHQNMLAQRGMNNGGQLVQSDHYGSPATLQGGPVPRLQPSMTRGTNPDQFVKILAQFMHQGGQPLNLSPMVGDRVINLMHLYAAVYKAGGSKNVNATGAWPLVAASMQFPPAQYPQAPQELKEHYEKNLSLYEEALLQVQQKQRAMQQMHQLQYGDSGIPVNHLSPTKPLDSQYQNHASPSMLQHQQQPPAVQPPQMPVRQSTFPSDEPSRHSSANGHVTPEPNQIQSKPPSAFAQQQPTYMRQYHAPSPHGPPSTTAAASPASAGRGESVVPKESPHTLHKNGTPSAPPSLPKNYSPRVRTLETHGGMDISLLGHLGAELVYHKPNVPNFSELGVTDIHALTMSLQSGLHAEVRLALDTLATLSVEPRFQLSLPSCEDLLEAIVECAEVQIEALAENAAEVSDVIQISPYEDVLRASRLEVEGLQDMHPFGNLEYNLDRAVERLICITTILRNLSFFESNHEILASELVLKLISTAIGFMGTRNMFLRTHVNTLDFMKDVVTYLSNLAHEIELPGRDDALSLLHFLLAFAPCPLPTRPGGAEVMFALYQPSVHRYLPPAVDSLAKLLARDEPNRSLYKAIFLNEPTASAPFDLLTRTFGLAISPIPEITYINLTALVEARKPYIVQGLLAAEVLANLAPGPESGVCRSWLSSTDGFAIRLLRLVSLLSTDRSALPARNPPGGRLRDVDSQLHHPVTHRGIAVLRRLVEKSQSAENGRCKPPNDVLMKKEMLLGILLTPGIDGNLVKELCGYAGLET